MANIIAPQDLVVLDARSADAPIIIDLVYADARHPENIFGAAIYRKGAPMVLHRALADIVLDAARLLYARHGWTLILKDGLRPVEAQEALSATNIVKAHPQWLVEPGRLLSPPGGGAHPRGMAVDVGVRGHDGADVNMGTVFDTMTAQSARDYTGLDATILQNRRALEEAFTDAAKAAGKDILPLPSEWWDFRFPRALYDNFAPLSDFDLPQEMRLMNLSAHSRTR